MMRKTLLRLKQTRTVKCSIERLTIFMKQNEYNILIAYWVVDLENRKRP